MTTTPTPDDKDVVVEALKMARNFFRNGEYRWRVEALSKAIAVAQQQKQLEKAVRRYVDEFERANGRKLVNDRHGIVEELSKLDGMK